MLDPALLLAAGGVACLVASVVTASLLAGLVSAASRRRRPDPLGLERAMSDRGWHRDGSRWTRRESGVTVVLEDTGSGWRWSARLPRYQEASLRVEERGDEWPPAPREGAFLAGDPDLDHRFRFLSPRPAPCLALLAADGVGDALLAVPWVELALSGDEVVLRDPARSGLERRLHARVDPAIPGARAQVLEQHDRALALLVALARARP